MPQINLRVSDELLERIDNRRGATPRERWLREAVEARLDANSRAFHVETPPAGGRQVLGGRVRTSAEVKAGIKPVTRD